MSNLGMINLDSDDEDDGVSLGSKDSYASESVESIDE